MLRFFCVQIVRVGFELLYTGPPPDHPERHNKITCKGCCQRSRWLWHALHMPLLWQRLALSVTSLLFFLAESESLTAWPGPGPSLYLPLMPPRTIVRCPGCSRGFAIEKELNNHRAQPSHRHLPCFLLPDLGARISSLGGPGSRVEMVDLESTYVMGGDRSPACPRFLWILRCMSHTVGSSSAWPRGQMRA